MFGPAAAKQTAEGGPLSADYADYADKNRGNLHRFNTAKGTPPQKAQPRGLVYAICILCNRCNLRILLRIKSLTHSAFSRGGTTAIKSSAKRTAYCVSNSSTRSNFLDLTIRPA